MTEHGTILCHTSSWSSSEAFADVTKECVHNAQQ